MANGVKDVKARIKSVKNIRKITKAMELVSVSKMRKAVQAVFASRAYAKEAWKILTDLAGALDSSHHPLLFRSPETPKNILLILLGSDRGLCGSFNTNLFMRTSAFFGAYPASTIHCVAIGRKCEEFFSRSRATLVASFSHLPPLPSLVEIQPVARFAIQGFLLKRYDKVMLGYTDFISTMKQKAVLHELLPLTYSEDLGRVGQNGRDAKSSLSSFEFKFEPQRSTVLDSVLPRLIEMQLYQAVLESVASEHAARMVAMKTATDAAGDMVSDLTFAFNQLRQAGITREIAEISAGKAVLE